MIRTDVGGGDAVDGGVVAVCGCDGGGVAAAHPDVAAQGGGHGKVGG